MKRIIVSLFICLLMIGGIAVLPSYSSDTALTNAELAELLVTTVGITLPAGSDQLGDAEYYDVVANLLAARGITYFKDNPMTGTVTALDFAGILYAMLGKTGATDPAGQLAALIADGSMPQIDANANISKDYALQALQNPLLKTLEAEKYHAPESDNPNPDDLNNLGAPVANPDAALSTT
ncbi:MAG: hypothetical protein PHS37_02590 [Candidatus Omnitrophica bacterium]|nr:hypothetical protein [Candidatus Omnitrophota bacterium]